MRRADPSPILPMVLWLAAFFVWRTGFRDAAFVAALIAPFAIATTIFWCWEVSNRRTYERQTALAITPENRRAEIISRMSDQQLYTLKAMVPTWEVVTTQPGYPEISLRLPNDTYVTMPFVERIFNYRYPDYLLPIGSYSEGTPEYAQLREFTNWCVQMGWAERAAGNRSAHWIDKDAAAEAVGLNAYRRLLQLQQEEE